MFNVLRLHEDFRIDDGDYNWHGTVYSKKTDNDIFYYLGIAPQRDACRVIGENIGIPHNHWGILVPEYEKVYDDEFNTFYFRTVEGASCLLHRLQEYAKNKKAFDRDQLERRIIGLDKDLRA